MSHYPTLLFSQNKPVTSNQPTVLFSQNKPAPAISHQPNEVGVPVQAQPTFFLKKMRKRNGDMPQAAEPAPHILPLLLPLPVPNTPWAMAYGFHCCRHEFSCSLIKQKQLSHSPHKVAACQSNGQTNLYCYYLFIENITQ
jgi:hypothetical protein